MSIMNDGYSTTLSFSNAGSQIDVYLYEKEVTPPGYSGGGANEASTMRNTTWRTNLPKSLITLTPVSVVGAYDPDVYGEILEAINVNQEIVLTFPDASTLTFWGWIDEFTPNPMVEGEQPTANLTVIPSNWNGSAEIAPVLA